MKQESSKNFVLPLAFVGLMFFTLGFALGINSFLIPVLKGSLNLSSGVAYLLLAATFIPFILRGIYSNTNTWLVPSCAVNTFKPIFIK